LPLGSSPTCASPFPDKTKKNQQLFLKTSESTTEVYSIIAEYPCTRSYRMRLIGRCNLMFIT
jgi:hypothetical protein